MKFIEDPNRFKLTSSEAMSLRLTWNAFIAGIVLILNLSHASLQTNLMQFLFILSHSYSKLQNNVLCSPKISHPQKDLLSRFIFTQKRRKTKGTFHFFSRWCHRARFPDVLQDVQEPARHPAALHICCGTGRRPDARFRKTLVSRQPCRQVLGTICWKILSVLV